MMTQGHDPAANLPGAFDVLIDEFTADIRRRVRAVERLVEPRRHSWSFDPDALPRDDAQKLVAIKREVEQAFNAAFSSHRRSRALKTHNVQETMPAPHRVGPRRTSRPAAR